MQMRLLKYNKLLLLCFIGCITICNTLIAQQWKSIGNFSYNGNPVTTSELCQYQGKLYITGGFNQVNGTFVNNIAVWDGTQWSSVGCLDGPEGSISTMCVYNNELYAAGSLRDICDLDTIGPNNVYVARWDGTQWKTAGGQNGDDADRVYAMCVYKGELYIGGNFTRIGGVYTPRIARWDGTQWKSVGGGVSNSLPFVNSLVVYRDKLYVGGSFYKAGTIDAQNIAVWDGMNWDSVGSGCNGIISSLVTDTVRDVLYVAGGYDNAGGEYSLGISNWDGLKWNPMTIDTLAGTRTMCIYRNKLFAGGGNVTVSHLGDTLNNIYQYQESDSTWRPVLNKGINGTVQTMIEYNGDLITGGNFTTPYEGITGYYEPPLGVKSEKGRKNILTVYPNPSGNQITINTELKFELLVVKDIAGRVIISVNKPSANSINISNLSQGIYYLTAVHKEQLHYASFVKD